MNMKAFNVGYVVIKPSMTRTLSDIVNSSIIADLASKISAFFKENIQFFNIDETTPIIFKDVLIKRFENTIDKNMNDKSTWIKEFMFDSATMKEVFRQAAINTFGQENKRYIDYIKDSFLEKFKIIVSQVKFRDGYMYWYTIE